MPSWIPTDTEPISLHLKHYRFMKAIEVSGRIDDQCRLIVEDLPLNSLQVKVIILFPDEADETIDPDNEPSEEVLAGLQRALQQIKAGERIPLSEIWGELENNEVS